MLVMYGYLAGLSACNTHGIQIWIQYKHSNLLLPSVCHISHCFIGSRIRGAVGVRALTKSYLHQVRYMQQVHDLGVHDRLID